MASLVGSIFRLGRRYAVSLTGGAYIASTVVYALLWGGPFSVLFLEIVLPLLIGIALLVYGVQTAQRADGRQWATIVTACCLATTAVGVFVAVWAVSVTFLRYEFMADLIQVSLLAGTVAGAVGAVVGHFYATLANTHRETAKLSLAVENSMDGVAIIQDFRHAYVNDSYARLYGYPDSSILEDEPWEFLYTNESVSTIENDALPTLEKRDYWRGRLTGVRFDGTTFPKEVTASVVEGNYVIIVRDVSEHLEQKQRIQVLNRVLRHNLRNTFTVLRGHANLIADQAPSLEQAHVEPIRDEIDDLLATAEKARGVERTLERREAHGLIDPSEAVRSTVDRATAAHPDATVRSHVEESGLPSVDSSIVDALDELVDNAVEHAECTDPTVEVSVGVIEYDIGTRVEFTVVDDGPGIPEPERQAVLDGEETPLEHGSGLGLWLVNWIVRNAGGELEFDDSFTGGTAVRISFLDDYSSDQTAVESERTLAA